MNTGRTVLRALACSIAPSVLLSLLACRTQAADFAYEGSVGLAHSDNIRREAANETSEEIATIGARFSLREQGARLLADLVGDFAYADYLNDTYESDVTGGFAGNAAFAFVPERFVWVAADNFGQVLSDPFAPATPDNREDINYFSTGPDLTLAFGSQNRLRLGARYALATYEDRPLDSDSLSGELAFIRQLSSASTLSLQGRFAQTDFDETALDADYDQSDAFLRYDTAGARTRFAVDAGYTRLKREAAPDQEDGLLFRLDVSRRLTLSTTASLAAGREFSNSASAFASHQVASGVNLQPAQGLQTALPFTRDYATLGWSFARNRTEFGLSGSWNDQSYVDAPQFDQTLTTVDARFRRELSRATSVSARVAFTQGEFEQTARNYDDWSGGLSFDWRLSRYFTARATYDYYQRKSDGVTGDITDNRYWISIAYGDRRPRESLALPEFGVDQQPAAVPEI
jgi:Putative beta-barrel porin 2